MTKFHSLLFISLLTVVLALMWSYVWIGLILPMELPTPLPHFLLPAFMATFLLQFYRFVRFHNDNPNKIITFITFFFMGLLFQLCFATLLHQSLSLLPALAANSIPLARGLFIGTLGLSLLGLRSAFRGPQIHPVDIPVKAASLNGFRIVQISDLHVGPLLKRAYVEDVVRKINSAEPDLVVLTGDIGDGHPGVFGKELQSLSDIRSRHGVYFITGNHEHIWNADAWIETLAKFHVRPLLNRGHLITPDLWLGGTIDRSARHFDGRNSDPDAALADNPNPEAFKVLLAHQPAEAERGYKAGFDLMLSGHTHNGQFFPANLFVGLFNPYSHGLNHHETMMVYVNSGTGFWGPPLRLGVPAEITLLTLRTDGPSSSLAQ